jgi:hypothetical protein
MTGTVVHNPAIVADSLRLRSLREGLPGVRQAWVRSVSVRHCPGLRFRQARPHDGRRRADYPPSEGTSEARGSITCSKESANSA